MKLPRPRLLPLAIAGMAALLPVKLVRLVQMPVMPAPAFAPAPPPRVAVGLLAEARASGPAPAPAQQRPAPAAPPAPPAEPPPPTPDQLAERALLESLRGRRAELDQREQALAAREMVQQAAERRLTQRIEELATLQQRLEGLQRQAGEREEAGWRQMVKLYEGMRPRDAAAIFNELEMGVLVQVVDRMREAKAAPVLGAMQPDRARLLTTELARHRARPAE